jgi:chromosome segregation ATPase
LFKGLSRDLVNELIKAINEKDELLKKQEDQIIDETKKNEKLEKALAHEKEKINFLTHGLISCNDSISSLQCANDDLNAKIVKLNDRHASSSSIEHVSICTRCKYVDVDACIANVSMIARLNGHLTKLKDQAKICKVVIDNEKIKYARGVYLNVDALGLRMMLAFKGEAKRTPGSR